MHAWENCIGCWKCKWLKILITKFTQSFWYKEKSYLLIEQTLHQMKRPINWTMHGFQLDIIQIIFQDDIFRGKN